MASILAESVSLPCGARISNRIAKSAMTEGLATANGVPTKELERLYGLWSDGGAGLLLSGNIQVDRNHLERPGNVIIDGRPDQELQSALSSWAAAATRGGNHFWAQISHAGRQTPKAINARPIAPSAVRLGIPGGQFGDPREASPDEIRDVIRKFGIAAAACKDGGFTGVQIHSAHGYLLSEFLSPRTNRRSDEYGGSLRGRARLLLEVLEEVRSTVGPGFPIAVKLNSADFQKGGFAFEDSLQVAQWLEAAGLDLLEVSGGTYEQPRLVGFEGLEDPEEQDVAHSTRLREAYFVDFAIAMRKEVSVPLMATGGFRTRAVMEEAVASGGIDMVGLGRPMCVDTDAPARLLSGAESLQRYEQQISLFPRWLNFLTAVPVVKVMAIFSTMYWFYTQLYRLGETGNADTRVSALEATRTVMGKEKRLLREMKA